MTDTQKIILIALLALGVLSLIVGATLSHYIGGFIRHVEEEAREEAEAEEARRAEVDQEKQDRSNP
jgi:hypothetical protein